MSTSWWTQGVERSQQERRQETMQNAVDKSKRTNELPPNARVFIAPKNNVTKPLEKVAPPPDLYEREYTFSRSVAMVLGLPSGGGQVLFCLSSSFLYSSCPV